jgi:hypothetical protein
MEKSDLWEVMFLLLVLAFALVIVEERWLRVAVAFVPSLLLVQRALRGSAGVSGHGLPEGEERRVDEETRRAVDELLRHIREFYLTVHLVGTGRMDSEEATEKIAELEGKLNRLLARMRDVAPGGAPAPAGAGASTAATGRTRA